MRNHSNRLLKRLMVVFAGIIAAFSLSGCTKSFCTNQDKANQLFAYYGNIYSDTLLIDENTKDEYDYSEDNASREALIKKQNTNRTKLFTTVNSSGNYTTWYELNSEAGKDFLTFMNDKAVNFRDTNYSLWMNGTLDDIKSEVEAKAIAWHVGIYAGLNKDDTGVVTGVSDLWVNMNSWYNEAINDSEIGILGAPANNYIKAIQTNAAVAYNANTACITPTSGVFEQGGSKIYIEGKTWGQAFKDYGFLEGLLVYPMAWLVHVISTSLGDTGWAQILAIVVVTLLVRLITVLSTLSQSKSQAKQQKIQPLLNELQKKYPDNQTDKEQRQALAMEQAKIMKKNKIHPMLPLLFMIIQFPLFICVWSALQGSAALAAGNWFGLSLTTRVSECFTNYKGTPGAIVGILVFILMSIANILSSMTGLWMNTWRTKNFGTMGIQTSKTDANGKPVDPNKTMKIMTYVMMVFVLIMGWSLPVGMGIYWFIGAVIAIAQSILTEALQARARHRNAANTGDGSTLAAIRRSSHHTMSDKKDKKNKKSDKPMWR